MFLSIQHVGVYTYAQTILHPYQFSGITFIVSGLDRMSVDGIEQTYLGPQFRISVPGIAHEVEMNEDRENWVIIFDKLKFTLNPNDRQSALFSDGSRTLSLPLFRPIAHEFVPGWRQEFQIMRAAWKSPTPQNHFRAELGVMNILRYMFDSGSPQPSQSPASQLKQSIDADTDFSRSLQSLSARSAYSSDHLRRLFQQEFGLTPQRYRNQRRMAVAMDYISQTELNVKEIAHRLGFEHMSAFNKAFRQWSGHTPGEAITRFRNSAQS